MGDRAAERRLCGLFRVHMNELVVVGRVGELVDPLLGDLEPRRWREFLPDQAGEVFGLYGPRHAAAFR